MINKITRQVVAGVTMFICLYGTAHSQNAYYDALRLRKYIVDETTGELDGRQDSVFIILASYFNVRPGDTVFHKTIRDSLNEPQSGEDPNPFLEVSAGTQGAANKSAKAGFLGLNNVGKLNVTNIADGIAQFLIKRGKEELNVAFFNRMKGFLEDPAHPEAKTLFPVTTEFLGKILSYRYAELIQTLREAFYKDLSNLLVNLNQLIETPKYRELLRNLPELRLAIRTSKIVSELSQSEAGILPDSLIHELAWLPEWNEIGRTSNLANSWKLLDVISQNVKDSSSRRSEGNSRRWIKLSDLNNIVKDKITLQLFIGLIYQEVHNRNLQFQVRTEIVRVDQFMRVNANTIHVVSGLIENFALLANDVDRTIDDFQDKQDKGTLTDDDYYAYINKAINILEYGFKVANTIKDSVINDDFIVIARNANELYKNIYTKNYNNAVMNVYAILNHAFADDLVSNPRLATSLDPATVNLVNSGSNPGRLDSLKSRLRSLGPNIEVIEKILKYGNFMASVIKAKSGEEVQQALEAAALPAGSYSIKQKSSFNLSVNGYIGYALDFDGAPFKNLYAHGIYAPVGLSASRGSTKKSGLTFTGFLGLIDVGALAAYRLDNDPAGSLKQEVRLESIFSPSLQLFVELGGWPLAFGAGWRRTPRLFYSNDNTFLPVSPKNAFNVSLLVDIPFFTIINRSFYKK